eukprot:PRCOL_00006277-RA
MLAAVEQAAEATARALGDGNPQALCELLIPELFDPLSGALMESEGDQMRLWALSRAAVELTTEAMVRGDAEVEYGEGSEAEGEGPATMPGVVAVYPDAGVAAMLQSRWGTGAPFRFASLDDRLPSIVREDTSLVFVCIPDPPSIKKVIAIAEAAAEAGAALVLFNPRLASGDVGVGLALRDTFRDFTLQMCVSYSIRPIGDGSVYKCYPAPWRVFLGDPELPGRYILAKEMDQRPNSEEIFDLMDALDDGTLGKDDSDDDEDDGSGGFMASAKKAFREAQKFQRDLNRI